MLKYLQNYCLRCCSRTRSQRIEGKQPIREWDLGKEEIPQRSRGQKRKHDAMSNGDLTSKKQRSDKVSQRAPWCSEVDWDSCRNVAEM